MKIKLIIKETSSKAKMFDECSSGISKLTLRYQNDILDIEGCRQLARHVILTSFLLYFCCFVQFPFLMVSYFINSGAFNSSASETLIVGNLLHLFGRSLKGNVPKHVHISLPP